MRMRRTIGLFMLLCAPSAAMAETDGEPIKLGPIAGYGTAAEAASHCVGDGVVWADRRTGFLYPRYMEQYGKTPDGTFACYGEAKKADYWGFGTIDTMGMKGKNFPLVICASCF